MSKLSHTKYKLTWIADWIDMTYTQLTIIENTLKFINFFWLHRYFIGSKAHKH